MILRTDGASRGNPGPSAVGVALLDDDGRRVFACGLCVEPGTNNQSEYQAVLNGVRLARGLGIRDLQIQLDSELVVKQLNGEYEVRDPSLAELKGEVEKIIGTSGLFSVPGAFSTVRISHIPREWNALADQAANTALDEGAWFGGLDTAASSEVLARQMARCALTAHYYAEGSLDEDKGMFPIRGAHGPIGAGRIGLWGDGVATLVLRAEAGATHPLRRYLRITEEGGVLERGMPSPEPGMDLVEACFKEVMIPVITSAAREYEVAVEPSASVRTEPSSEVPL